jgi:hypothetical protein
MTHFLFKSFSMKWTITIDYHKDGHFDVWTQEREKLPNKDKEKLRRLKAKIKKLVKEEKQPELI